MEHKILAFIILLLLFFSPLPTANALELKTITPIADTYVDVQAVNSTFGQRDYLEVSEHATGFSIALLMFDLSEVSHVPNAPSEITLRLYCFYVASPHIIGAHWCVNNTWNEENLTFVSFGKFFRTNPESVVKVDSMEVWYEWKVTNLVSNATEENYEKITLALEVKDPLEGMARSLYASRDQPTQEMREYSPQLVFAYLEPKANSLGTIIILASGLTVTIAIVFLAYKFSKRRKQKTQRRKGRVHSK